MDTKALELAKLKLEIFKIAQSLTLSSDIDEILKTSADLVNKLEIVIY